MEHHVRVGYLLTWYGGLLTERQREAMRLAYDEDWSLSEIAEACQISRQAVHDALHRGETVMEEAEASAGLLTKYLRVRENLETCLELAEDPDKLPELRRMLAAALETWKGDIDIGI